MTSDREIVWRLHLSSAPERVFRAWLDVDDHRRFWCEQSRPLPDGFELEFIDGTRERCVVTRAVLPSSIEFVYFGARVDIAFTPVETGTDVTLRARGVSAAEWEDTYAGWLSVLLPFKAWIDFGIDLRNHDGTRTWRERYVDQ